ncbi:HN1_G0003230.mRNA.1.CDS.1 [Saccharomyces cerevisiae]|nr:HN1_G0003230.mRNA.1.CDS.1 [Saccharomyces cerevisiae]CAI4561741.1 BAL_1a_G0031260.mRNA.1.CDS.1 [Saccharomyces cerevisiae]CAI7193243.1 BAL_1a_G0031260.mRNA.1.CDS.1 [Saccharomyces cerevisiae]
MPGEPWSTLTPSATTSCGATEFTSFFDNHCPNNYNRIYHVKKNTDITTTLIGTYIDKIKEGATAITVTDFSIYSDKKSTSTLPLSFSISSAISFSFLALHAKALLLFLKKTAVVPVTTL